MGMNSPDGLGNGFVAEQPLSILQVSTVDNRGGAARIAWSLHRTYRKRNLYAWMVVGQKFSNDPNILSVCNEPRRIKLARVWSSAKRWLNIQRGHEDFDFPGSRSILNLPPYKPNVVHCHNLHGGYFDLRALPWLSHSLAVLLTLHDSWLLSGHCAHSFNCDKWKSGCKKCPDLSIYPAIMHDGTSFNWHRKKKIYARSQLYIATPCKWLMGQVEKSILAPSVIESKVIPNGIDLDIFHPAEKQTVRDTLHIAQDTKVLLFLANGIKENIWKDYHTLRNVIALLAENQQYQKLLFIALGEDGPVEQLGKAEIRFLPYQEDSHKVALYYQAADIYVHAARADTFPNTVLEALACGTPVIATSVGGIPEQIVDGQTGFLTQPGDATAMADKITKLLGNNSFLRKMGTAAGDYARTYFGLDRMVNDYLSYYQEILEREKKVA